jgi:hypothetical protein
LCFILNTRKKKKKKNKQSKEESGEQPAKKIILGAGFHDRLIAVVQASIIPFSSFFLSLSFFLSSSLIICFFFCFLVGMIQKVEFPSIYVVLATDASQYPVFEADQVPSVVVAADGEDEDEDEAEEEDAGADEAVPPVDAALAAELDNMLAAEHCEIVLHDDGGDDDEDDDA